MDSVHSQQSSVGCHPMVSAGNFQRKFRRSRSEVARAPTRRARLLGLHPVTSGQSPVTRHPIVLVHGFLGFDSLGIRHLSRRYFRGVREFLETLGCHVYVLSLPATSAVAVRATELVRQVNEIREDRVNVVAHSMGGLDARYAVSKLGMSRRAASVVTLGTPHRGTPIADLVESGVAFVTGEGLHDLTTARAAELNAELPDSKHVFYGSIVGSSTSVQGCLSAGYEYLRRIAGPNDGVVPASSQPWGKVLGEVDADHLAQVGWSRHFDARPLYAALVRQLASIGG